MKLQALKAALVGTTIVAAAFGASAANAATASADARAKIVTAITVTKTADLQFGTIVPDTATGTRDVTVNTAGARTCATGLICAATATAAAFNVTGTANQIVTVSVPASITLTSGGNNMPATLVSSIPSGVTTLSGTGTASFTVGGTLTVGQNQPVGDYAVAFDATVNYQ